MQAQGFCVVFEIWVYAIWWLSGTAAPFDECCITTSPNSSQILICVISIRKILIKYQFTHSL